MNQIIEFLDKGYKTIIEKIHYRNTFITNDLKIQFKNFSARLPKFVLKLLGQIINDTAL